MTAFARWILVVLTLAPLPVLGAARERHDCAALAVSVLPAPSWYARACLGQTAAPPAAATPAPASGRVPGDLVYYKNNFPAPQDVKTAPLQTLNFTIKGPLARPIFAMDFDNASVVLWGVDNTTREYGTIDLNTGAFTVVGTVTGLPPGTPTQVVILGMKFDPTNSNVYLSAADTQTSTAQLYTLNLTTGALTVVGPLNFLFTIDIAISAQGQMYGHDISADTLVLIDKTTGASTVIGPTGLAANFAQGMDFDLSDGTLYGFAYVTSPAQQGELVTFNLATGAATVVAGPVPDELEGAVKLPSGPGPTGLVATANGPNQIGLTWDAVPGAASYRVYRANGACPQTLYSQIATGLTSPVYTDTAVSGGSTYAYVVTWVASNNAESTFSNCDDAVATGACTLPPTFAGLSSVTQPTPGSCRLDLAWSAGTASCTGATLKYNVYRSTDPVFTPGPSNLIQTCLTGTTYADTTVTSGSTYYYVVRAEDSTTSGSGPCNNGNTESNLVRKSGNPDTVTAFFDDMEGGTTLWTVDDPGAGNPWLVVTTQSNSPTHSWFVDDPATVTDQRLVTANPVPLSSGSTLSFWHRYDMELGPPPYDGGVLEYSTDGTTWFDILAGNGGSIPANAARFLSHPYQTTPISGGFMNPLAGRRAWSGPQLTFVETRVDLADFAGQSVRFRWRRGTDNSVSDVGWWVDDVRITRQQACGTASAFIRGDFNSDGKTDILWRHDESGENVLWYMNGSVLAGGTFTTPAALTDTRWKMVGTHDFNADLRNDILWRHDTAGQNVLWYMNGSVLTTGEFLTPAALEDINWKMAGTGLFNADGRPDIAWHHQDSGQIVLWYMNGSVLTTGTFTTPSSFPDTNWRLVGVADFSAPLDGKPDFVWRNQVTGENLVWFMNNDVKTGEALSTPLSDLRWKVVATGDYNLDLKNDFVWRHDDSGENVIWYMNGAVLTGGTFTTPAAFPDTRWKMVGPR